MEEGNGDFLSVPRGSWMVMEPPIYMCLVVADERSNGTGDNSIGGTNQLIDKLGSYRGTSGCR